MVLRYKPDEGRNARQAPFWLGMAMIGFGSYSFRGFLNSWLGMRNPLIEGMAQVPIIGADLNGSLALSVGLFLLLSILWIRFLARPRIADHLIEVENEMRKVTWPSFKEASNSSMVVIATVAILMGFMALSDFALGRIFDALLFQNA